MPSFLKQRHRAALALLAAAGVLLVAVGSVTLLGDDGTEDAVDDFTAAPETSTTTPGAGSDGGTGGPTGGDLGGGDLDGGTTTTTATGTDGAPEPGNDGGTGRAPLSGSIVVDAPVVQEGPAEEGAPEPTPISEAAALACANVEFAIDAWDADDPGAYQSHLAEAIARAGEADEPAIGAAVPALEEASTAEDPAPAITRFLEACVASGYAV